MVSGYRAWVVLGLERGADVVAKPQFEKPGSEGREDTTSYFNTCPPLKPVERQRSVMCCCATSCDAHYVVMDVRPGMVLKYYASDKPMFTGSSFSIAA